MPFGDDRVNKHRSNFKADYSACPDYTYNYTLNYTLPTGVPT